MTNATKGLIMLAALAFALAVAGKVMNAPLLGIEPEAYSRACSNLALLAIALGVAWTPRQADH